MHCPRCTGSIAEVHEGYVCTTQGCQFVVEKIGMHMYIPETYRFNEGVEFEAIRAAGEEYEVSRV